MSTPIARLYNFVNDKNSGVPITASRVDAELNQLVTSQNRTCVASATAPSSPEDGDVWVDTANNYVKWYNNDAWVIVGSSLDDVAISGTATINESLKLTETTAPTTAASEGALYTKDTSGQPELFFREESSGDEVQLTSGGKIYASRYVDRGNFASYDFNSLSTDAWTDLDLSAIVPAGALFVRLTLYSTASSAGGAFQVRKNGYANEYNSITINGQSTYTYVTQGVIGLDANRLVEYYVQSGKFTSAAIAVLGWFI